MQFLALGWPFVLAGGAAAVSIPVALHFFYRARYRPLPWAPMKFLKEAIEQTSRRLKFQEWLLLLLRCLVILLLAFAIARPGCQSTAGAGRGEAIDAVLVIDTSYSMAALDGDKTRLERAKEAALAVIDSLPDKSSVQVYACSDRAVLLGPVSRFNRDQAKQIVRQVELTSLSTDFLPGLTDALAAAESGSAPAKEVYVFTDMQKTGFERQQGAVRGKCEEVRGKASLVFIRCGNPERKVPNLAVVDVSLHATIPHTKTRVPFVVTLRNTGRDPVRGAKVALELDGKVVGRDESKDAVQVEQIDPGNTATVTLTGNLDEPGPRVLSVQVEGDGLPGDNVLYKIVPVREKVRVLLVAHPFAGQNVTDAGDWFVRKALVPFDVEKERDRIEKYYIETESATPHEVDAAKLASKDVVYLLNAPVRGGDPLAGLPPEFVERLADFVKGGGGLVVGCGDAIDPAAYNRVFGAEGAGLLPFPLGGVRNTTDASPFTPAPESVASPSVLTPPDDKERNAFHAWFRRATLSKMIDLDESAPGAAGGRVLMRTTDGRPLVASRVVGDGEVVFFATSLDESWGRMMSDGSLAVPMTTYIVAHLSGRKVPGGVRTAGDPITWNPPTQAAYELVKPRKPASPSGEKTRPRVKLGEARTENGRLALSTADTVLAGEYAIVQSGAADDAGPVFVVNPDRRETENLDAITDGELEKLLGFHPTVIAAGAGTESAVRDTRVRGEWTEWVLLALLFLLVGEAAWAWVCGRAW